MDTQQQQFDQEYITSSEIMKDLGISRAGFLYGRRAGKVPTPIVLNEGRVLLFRRKEVEEPVRQWKQEIEARKSA